MPTTTSRHFFQTTAMTRTWYGFLAGATLLGVVACDSATSTEQSDALASAALRAALVTAPVGYGELASSYVGTTAAEFSDASLWIAGGREAAFGRDALMGGGLADEFVGGVTFAAFDGRGPNGGGHGPHGPGGPGHPGPFGAALRCGNGTTGTFKATTQRVECPTETANGITVVRSVQYKNAGGAVQQAFDTITTNSVNFLERVTGTVTYTRAAADTGRGHGPHGPGWGFGRGSVGRLLGDTATILTATTTVSHQSDRTTTGLAQGSTSRTTNGTSNGTESTTGTSSTGAFTANRTTADTTRGVVVPVRAAGSTTPTYPTAGTVIRVMTATLTYTGKAAQTLSRREVVTYDGSATAKVTITENGTTKSCTQALPRGRLVCP
jgi:hypothetical protein